MLAEGRAEPMPATTDFVGRTAELELLDEALDAVEHADARVVDITGPAGIGKTRLLAELALRADARGHVVLSGCGAELEQDLPLWVFVDALDEYVEGLDPRRLERLDALVRAELGQVLPALAGGEAVPAAALHERYRTHRAIRELLEQLAATKPLVLILDDFHWADAASVDLLVALLHRPPAAGVLLTIASRPRQLPARLASALERAQRDRTLSRLELTELTREEAEALLGPGAAEVYAESGGNPFFLEQLARQPGAGAGGAAGGVELAGLTVPPLVAAALTEELALLTGGARAVLDGASVAGDPFEIDVAAAAADVPEREVLDAIDTLARTELVHATDMPRRFRFRHPIVRRAVYDATPGGWRIGAHERVAAMLADRGASATACAHHVERSARHGDPAAITTLREAGAESAPRAPATAARWFGAALGLLPDDAPAADRVALGLQQARALIATGRFDDGHEALRQCLEILPADGGMLRTQVATMLARVEHLLGRHEQAHARLLQALDELPEHACEHCVALMIELTMDGLHRMDYEAMREWGRRALAAASDVDDDVLRATALAAAARGAALEGRTTEAMSFRDAAAGIVDALPDGVLARRLESLTLLAGSELYLHYFAEGHAHAERAVVIGRATDQGQQFPLLHAILGMTGYFQGRAKDMVAVLDDAVEAARLTGNAQTLAWSLYPRAMVAIALGDLRTAVSAAQEAIDAVDDGRPSHHVMHSAFALAVAQLELGRPSETIELLERATGGPDLPSTAPSFRALFLDPLVQARLAVGDAEGAARAAALARESAERAAIPLQEAFALRAAAAVALAGGDALGAAERALAAAELQAADGSPIEAARSLTLAGRALEAAGDRARAREVLEQAAHILDERGAVRWRDAAERELRRLGHRIHRRSSAGAVNGEGVGSLTARELEIARAIVERKTNREIAESLFLSPKTVETHIRNIFGKLGADSRVEVARVVEHADRVAAGA